MLTYILWGIGAVIAAGLLYLLVKILLIVLGIRAVIGAVKEEIEELPKDYAHGRKIVQNEHATVGGTAKDTAKLVGRVGWRWFKKL